MAAYYLEYALTSTIREIYLLPCTLDAMSSDEARNQSKVLLKSSAPNLRDIQIRYGPKLVDGPLDHYLGLRKANWKGHVQAGTLDVEQVGFKPFVELDSEELEFVYADNGKPIVKSVSKKLQLCRVLSNPLSKPEGEVFALLVVGNMSLDVETIRSVLGGENDA